MIDVVDEIKQRLTVLMPTDLEIVDESALHAGHAGAKAGGHYKLRVISPAFAGQMLVSRHRAVYQALGDLMQTRIHALSITALTPDES